MIKRWALVGLCLACALSICTGCHLKSNTTVQPETQKSNHAEEENKHFEIVDKSTVDAQKYEYIIYTKEGEAAWKEEVSREPHIRLLQNGLLEIMTSHGSPAQLYRYYDINNNAFSSESFWNRALVLDDGKIVYMSMDEESKTVLVIQDIFDKEKYYKEIHRDFSPLAVPSLTLLDAQVTENGDLEITYYSGSEQNIENETISLQ